MLCLCYNESKCESLLCKLFLFSSEFGCPLDSDFINNIFMKTLSWSTHSQYLATFYKNISSTEAYNTFWDTFNKYPHNSSDIIELIVKSISFFQDYNYCINCIQLIEKNHINLIFLYISSGFEILLKLTNYPQVKDLVKKYLHKSTITEKLVYNIRINEYLVPEPDFVFIRSLFEKYISMKRTPSVDFWIEYISFEYYVIKNSKIWGIDYASNLYSRVIKTLSGSSVQEFVSRFSLLQANK
ncbi:hypothetical protein HZS_2271 [Henneguya salminicola]|nr:hypothetical protein HZS_2271 [Henneguya salminicola]